MCVALLGLSVALGGTTWAAVSLPPGSVGTAQLKTAAVTGEKIKPRAVTGDKVKDGSLTGDDIKLSSLGAVPEAVHATSADSATHAATAETAKTALAAGTAYSARVDSAGSVPAVPTAIATLHVGAGSYVVLAKSQVDTFGNIVVGCDLVAGADKDSSFVQGAGTASTHMSQMLDNALVHTFASPDVVSLTCTGFGPANMSQIRITAVPVGSIVTS
ncbi:MAG TPA: hypothetical protein VGK92_11525 [Gaiellales bacterium]|jgi:hypothetical protein